MKKVKLHRNSEGSSAHRARKTQDYTRHIVMVVITYNHCSFC